MKVLFCGLGSIGSRHIKNLAAALGSRGLSCEFDALRSSDRPLADDVAALVRNSYRSFGELPDDYDVAYITNPTSLHYDTIQSLVPKARDMFIEKPLFDSEDREPDLLELREDGVYYVACPLRHKRVVRRMKELCAAQTPVAVRAICSSYLPDWRPGTDYRQCYSAKRTQGGGVPLDLIHEWDYLTWLLGFPREVRMFSGQRSSLDITSDDVAVYIADYGTTLLSLQLDYIGRVPVRCCELYFNDETVACDINAGTLTYKKSGRVETLPDDDFYRSETDYFLDCVLNRTRDNMNTVENAYKVLRTAVSEGEIL
ncbi:MAG: Gfo/Idh/MocA family oxidoreductase [Oscillospiraceae bacterium]|nr:Gfo/Idh/MocA family oxidoreductase [Oscillospiraceae bacterium]